MDEIAPEYDYVVLGTGMLNCPTIDNITTTCSGGKGKSPMICFDMNHKRQADADQV